MKTLIHIIAPFCQSDVSPWFSPGRERKLSQLSSILHAIDLNYSELNTCPEPVSAGQPTVQQLCSSNWWLLRLLQLLCASIRLRLGGTKVGQSHYLWLYNTRLSEALVALLLRSWSKQPSRLILQLEDLPAARRANAGTRGWLDRCSLQILSRRASAACCVSETVAQAFHQLSGFPRERIYIFPPLLEDSFLDKISKRHSPFSKSSIRVLYAGGYDIEKGVADLLYAFCSLKNPHYVLDLAGPVPEGLRQKLNNSQTIQIHGVLPLPALFDLYCQADIVVNPHRPIRQSNYVFPFKTIEILASGALPLCTPMPGLETYPIPNDCLFNNPEGLLNRLTNAKDIWEKHKKTLHALAAKVRHEHSMTQAEGTIQQMLEFCQ